MEVNACRRWGRTGDPRGRDPGPGAGPAGATGVTAPAVPDTVPGVVGAEHGHLRQDEQAGEPQGHRPRHGPVPRAVRQGGNPADPGASVPPTGSGGVAWP